MMWKHGKLSCSQDPTQDTKILFNFNIWVGYGLSLDHTGQTKLYKPQQSLVLILRVFRVRRAYRGSFFFSLVLILRIPAYLGIKGDQFFSDDFFSALVLCTNWCTTICITCPISRGIVRFLCKIECIQYVCYKFVLVLVQIDLIQFEFSNCVRSICTKTNTNLLHTNLLHSILHKIEHVIQIVVHQFVHKTSAKKNHSLMKIGPLLSPGMREYVESVQRRKKLIPYKPYVCGKHVESILGTRENTTKKSIQFE